MFGGLVKFKNQAILDENPYGVYYSEDGSVYAMEIVGTFITSGDTDEHLRIRNLDDINVLEEFKSFINENAVTRTDVDINLGDKVGILSTCTYEYNNARYAVVVVFKKQYLSLDEEKQASLTK
jgi:sortase B